MINKNNLRSALSIAHQYIANKFYQFITKKRLEKSGFDCESNYNEGILQLDEISLHCDKEDFAAIIETCILNDYQKIPATKILKGDTIFDIGAHVGSFSIWAAKLGAVVYAFEPSTRNYEILLKNIKLNNLEGSVIPFNIGIYNINGVLGLNTHVENTAGYTVTEEYTEQIKVRKLSTFMEEQNIKKVDLMKIDVEGSEYEIFTEEFNSLPITKIVGEYHLDWRKPKWKYSSISKLLPSFRVGRYIPYYFYAIKKQ